MADKNPDTAAASSTIIIPRVTCTNHSGEVFVGARRVKWFITRPPNEREQAVNMSGLQ